MIPDHMVHWAILSERFGESAPGGRRPEGRLELIVRRCPIFGIGISQSDYLKDRR